MCSSGWLECLVKAGHEGHGVDIVVESLDLVDELQHGGHPHVGAAPAHGASYQVPQHGQLVSGGQGPGDAGPGGSHRHAQHHLAGDQAERGRLDSELTDEGDGHQLHGRTGGDQVDTGHLHVSAHDEVPHVPLAHQSEQEALNKAKRSPGNAGHVLVQGGEQELPVERVHHLQQLPVLLHHLLPCRGNSFLLFPFLSVLINQPQPAQPLLVGHHQVRHHACLDTCQVPAPLAPPPGLRGHRAALRPHLAGVLVAHVPLYGPPPEPLASLTALHSVVNTCSLVTTHCTHLPLLLLLLHPGLLLHPEGLLLHLEYVLLLIIITNNLSQ